MSKPATRISIDDIDSRSRIILRRSAGKRLSDCSDALAAFYKNVPAEIRPIDEPKYFSALTLACALDKEGANLVPIEEILSNYRAHAGNPEAFDRRLSAMMNTRWSDSDGLLALQMYRILRAYGDGYSPDCGALFDDLKYWNSPDGRVLRKWSRRIYRDYSGNQKNEEEN